MLNGTKPMNLGCSALDRLFGGVSGLHTCSLIFVHVRQQHRCCKSRTRPVQNQLVGPRLTCQYAADDLALLPAWVLNWIRKVLRGAAPPKVSLRENCQRRRLLHRRSRSLYARPRIVHWERFHDPGCPETGARPWQRYARCPALGQKPLQNHTARRLHSPSCSTQTQSGCELSGGNASRPQRCALYQADVS